MQQHLPLAVLKQNKLVECTFEDGEVATALTACGIETFSFPLFFHAFSKLQQHLPLAVLKPSAPGKKQIGFAEVATALTACGIETL